jgi:hypothetical protein
MAKLTIRITDTHLAALQNKLAGDIDARRADLEAQL